MRPAYRSESLTVYCGDCLDIIPDLPPVDAVIADPPYSSGGQYRGDRMASCRAKYVQTETKAHRPEFSGDNRDQRAYLRWSELWMRRARELARPGSPLIVFSDWRQLPTTTDAVQVAGWTWRNLGTWHKPGVRMQRGRFSSSAEYLVYATNGPTPGGARAVQNVFAWPTVPNKHRTHIAAKPVDVLEWALSVAPAGGTVLDPFAGSAPTIEAAARLGLRLIAIESDPAAVDLILQRLEG